MDKSKKHLSTFEIAKANDSLRNQLPNSLPFPHQLVLSRKVAALSTEKIHAILILIRDYDCSNTAFEICDENDFGSIEFENKSIFWKFDYYELDDAIFKENTKHVLTIMLDHEY